MTLEGTLHVSVADTDAVTFELHVTNTGAEPVTLRFMSGCRADFAVSTDDTERWRFSDGRMFTQSITDERIDPGETTVYDATWREPDPGTYTASAKLEATDHPVEATADFSV